MDQAWAGVDAGKEFHWAHVLDASGTELLSRKVQNDEADILRLIRSGAKGSLVDPTRRSLQNAGYRLRRIPLPRTSVNKGKTKDRDVIGPNPSCFSGSVSDSLGRYLLFKTRRHKLRGLGLDKR
jgi:Transposase